MFLDGEPVPGAAVMLQPVEGSFGFGVCGDDGKFVISTYELGDGAIPGEHGIIVTMKEMATFSGAETQIDGDTVDPGTNLPERYAKTATSGLKVSVTKNLKPLELYLTSD